MGKQGSLRWGRVAEQGSRAEPSGYPSGGALNKSETSSPNSTRGRQLQAVATPMVDKRAPLSCQMMSPEEVAALSVSCSDVGSRLTQTLEQFGAAIVTDVLSKDECMELEKLFAADVSSLIDDEKAAKRFAADVHSLPLATAGCLGDMNRCQLRGLPHGSFAWASRLHPNVRRCYEVIHGTDDLVSSCDNSFFAPDAAEEQSSNKNWPHVDHNKNDNGSIVDEDGLPLGNWDVYQGLLYVRESTSSRSSTTALWCGSHLDVYERMMQDSGMKQRGREGNHFSRIQDIESEAVSTRLMAQWRQNARRVPMPAGSLLLWSSRTMHQGWSGGPRLAQPVCWEPKKRRSQQAYDTKLRMAGLGLPSTHWASLGIPHTLVDIKPTPATRAGRTRKGVVLPLKSTLTPATLRADASIGDMWTQVMKTDWKKPLPQDEREYLEACLLPDIVSVL